MEHEGYAEAQSTGRREGKERDGAGGLLEAILNRDNLNRAYKRVRKDHGAAGIDGMTVEEALPWLKEHKAELFTEHPRWKL
ncbi:MAG: reverse transcriptase [Clostridiales bacterium]|nr:reverse transcriptase [Clostridiales bacterium]